MISLVEEVFLLPIILCLSVQTPVSRHPGYKYFYMRAEVTLKLIV